MRVMLRIELPDNHDGDDALDHLVRTWLHSDGMVKIKTDIALIPVKLTYVKEQ